MIAQAAIVPAQPGYFVMSVIFGTKPDDPPEVYKEPVIAWKVDIVAETLRPLCIDEKLDDEEWAILYPDGKVLDRDRFDSIEGWLLFRNGLYEAEVAARERA